MMLFDRALYKENKALKTQIEELKKQNQELKNQINVYKKRIKIDKECMLLEVINTYMKEKNLYEDFEHFLRTYTGNAFQESNEVVKIWDKY